MSSNLLQVIWNPPDYPNGIIRYYLIFRNESRLFNTTGKLLQLLRYEILSFFISFYFQKARLFEDSSVRPFEVYSYKVQAFNDEGSTISRAAFVSIVLPTNPCCTFHFFYSNTRSTSVDMIWSEPEKKNGLNMSYLIKVYQSLDPTLNANSISLSNLVEQQNSSVQLFHNFLVDNGFLTNNNFEYTLSNLFPYTKYFISIDACNRDLRNETRLFCLKGTVKSNTNSSKNMNFIELVTSQDKPQNQPAPTLISSNTNSALVGVPLPLKPNGIILLYEIWISNLAKSDSKYIACVIEDRYDPNDYNSVSNAKLVNTCEINNLLPNTQYYMSVTSSTIIGRSLPSDELVFRTQEREPSCPPKITNAFSYRSDSIFFSWLPSYNMSLNVPNWLTCIQGNLRRFNLYQLKDRNFSLIYTGLENTFNLTNLNFSTEYEFKVELCNAVGCFSSDTFKVVTADPLPNSWNNLVPTLQVINASMVKLDWSNYVPLNNTPTNLVTNITYRLERAEISFAYPPTALESGVRFHGFNYFVFKPGNQFYPEGYPYFGLKYHFRTKSPSSLIYFAGSSFAQNELTLNQLLRGKNKREKASYLNIVLIRF